MEMIFSLYASGCASDDDEESEVLQPMETAGTSADVVPFNTGEANNSGVVTQGSNLPHQHADAIGLTNELAVVEGGGHSAPLICPDCLIQMRSFLFGQL